MTKNRCIVIQWNSRFSLSPCFLLPSFLRSFPLFCLFFLLSYLFLSFFLSSFFPPFFLSFYFSFFLFFLSFLFPFLCFSFLAFFLSSFLSSFRLYSLSLLLSSVCCDLEFSSVWNLVWLGLRESQNKRPHFALRNLCACHFFGRACYDGPKKAEKWPFFAVGFEG